jgi:hypothetical protein
MSGSTDSTLMRRFRVNGHTVQVWGIAPDDGMPGWWAVSSSAPGLHALRPARFAMLGPAIDDALRLVAGIAPPSKPKPYPGYDELPAAVSVERFALERALTGEEVGSLPVYAERLLKNYRRLLDMGAVWSVEGDEGEPAAKYRTHWVETMEEVFDVR